MCGPKRDSRGHRPEARDHRPDTLRGQIPEARHPTLYYNVSMPVKTETRGQIPKAKTLAFQ